MTEGQQPANELVFMLASDDENGDHHIFVATDKVRAEALHRAMLTEFTNVKAHWLEFPTVTPAAI